jgi:hypothetical protein
VPKDGAADGDGAGDEETIGAAGDGEADDAAGGAGGACCATASPARPTVSAAATTRVLIMAPSLPTSLRSLLWHARVQERESSELGLQHVPHCKAFDLAGRQVRPIRPKSTRFSPPAIRASAAFPAKSRSRVAGCRPGRTKLRTLFPFRIALSSLSAGALFCAARSHRAPSARASAAALWPVNSPCGAPLSRGAWLCD